MKNGAVEIAYALQGKRDLVKLSIENNQISNDGLQAISKSLMNCS
jgi:hypothetical protein